MLNVSFISKNCFFCIIDIFYDSYTDSNNNKLISCSDFLKNILYDVLCIDKSIHGNNVFIYSKLYLDRMKLKFLVVDSIFLKGKNIYYVFIFDEYIFFKFFNSLLFFNFCKNNYIKYGMYIQPIYFYMNDILYFSYFNNYFNFILYREFFFFLEKFLSLKNGNNINYCNISFKMVNKSKCSNNYYLFILRDILLYYIEGYVNIVYWLL